MPLKAGNKLKVRLAVYPTHTHTRTHYAEPMKGARQASQSLIKHFQSAEVTALSEHSLRLLWKRTKFINLQKANKAAATWEGNSNLGSLYTGSCGVYPSTHPPHLEDEGGWTLGKASLLKPRKPHPFQNPPRIIAAGFP